LYATGLLVGGAQSTEIVTFWFDASAELLLPLLEHAAAGNASAAAAANTTVRRRPDRRRTVLFIDLPSLSWT
jgi:hypothetical protein